MSFGDDRHYPVPIRGLEWGLAWKENVPRKRLNGLRALKVIGWGWFYMSTILDDFSRYIVAWKLCITMRAGDVTETLRMALKASGCDRVGIVHRPRLLSDNGSSYIAGDLAEWLKDQGMDHVRGAPNHPQTQGKIERWHQTLKNRILLENYFLPGDLEAGIGTFIEHYNHRRYHESVGNLTPADVYFGRDLAIIGRRRKIKDLTIKNAAWPISAKPLNIKPEGARASVIKYAQLAHSS
jgi:transposase InsO family protein